MLVRNCREEFNGLTANDKAMIHPSTPISEKRSPMETFLILWHDTSHGPGRAHDPVIENSELYPMLRSMFTDLTLPQTIGGCIKLVQRRTFIPTESPRFANAQFTNSERHTHFRSCQHLRARILSIFPNLCTRFERAFRPLRICLCAGNYSGRNSSEIIRSRLMPSKRKEGR